MKQDIELLSRVIESFGGDVREGQRTMVEAVADALQDDATLLIQAGTGTGKSRA